MADNQTRKKISAKEIMIDLKAGMSDADLMAKYKVSFQNLQDIFEKLIQAGLATKSYFEKRSLKLVGSRATENSNKTCPYCGYTSTNQFRECPRCRQDVSEWLDTMELTKILAGSLD